MIEGKEKTFTTGFISTRKFREALKMHKKLQDGIDEKGLDELVEFVAGTFNNQFTIDEVYDGLESKKLLPTVLDVIEEVIGDEAKEMQQQDFLHKKNQ